MSIAGISSSYFVNAVTPNVPNRLQNVQQAFQQLGQDLQSGNLAAAQSDVTTLQQSGPKNASNSQTQSNSPVVSDFNQLSQDLSSGNLPASQQDFAKLQQDLQSAATRPHHHHHHHQSDGSGGQIGQLLNQLGQALQSGNLSSAQQAYNTLQQDFQQLGQNNLQSPTTPSSTSTFSANV